MHTNLPQSSSKHVLAIDLGTGGPKVGIVSLEGEVIASASGKTPIYFLPGQGAEQDPAEWWSASVGAARQAIQAAQVPVESIIAVIVTGQWGVIAPVDEHGEPLMRAVHWADTRGGPYNQQIVGGFPMVQGYGLRKLLKWLDVVGMPPLLSGGDSMGHIQFIKNELPDIYRRTHKFLEPMDYINMRLTGKFVATSNTTIAYFLNDNRDLHKLEYHPWLLEASGVDVEKLPELIPINGVIGHLTASAAAELGLRPETQVVASCSDNSSSAIGSGGVQDGEITAVLGTSGYIAVHYPKKKSDMNNFIVTIPSATPDRYLVIAETSNTCKVIDSVLFNMFLAEDELEAGGTPDDVYQRYSQMAAQVPAGSNGVMFLPWFNGAMSPQGDDKVRGGFLNLTNRTTRRDLARAVMEGIAFNWRWLRGAVDHFIGTQPTYWRLTGGGALSDVWAQIMADVVGLPMHQQADPRNSNVLGASFIAFQRLGLLSWEEIPAKVKFARIFEPDEKNRAIYEKMYAQYRAAYKQLRPVFHKLNG